MTRDPAGSGPPRAPGSRRAPAGPARPRLSALLGRLVLLALVVWVQVWIAGHELEHLVHQDDAPCAVCALAAGHGAPLPALAALPSDPIRALALHPRAHADIPPARGHRPQAARAPPVRLRA